MILLKKNKPLLISIIAIALPAIIEMALNTLLNISDTIMISWFIGKEGLAATGFCNEIMFALIFIFSSFNTGATAMISRLYGEKNYPKLNKVIGQNLLLNILIGIVIFTFSILFTKEIFTIYDISPTVFHMAQIYFKSVSPSILFMFISFASAASLRGAGDTKTPMFITIFTNIFNIIGNYCLMTGFWIFPNLGIEGAAIATSCARFTGILIYLYILLKGKNNIKVRLATMKVSKEILKPLWRISYPGAIEQFALNLSFIAFGMIISKLDTNSEAAFRILISIEKISFMPAIGLSIAAATLVGKTIGEKNIEKALYTGYTASFLGALWGTLIGIVFICFPTFLLGIFTKESIIINSSVFTMIIAGITQPLFNLMIVLSGSLRGTGDTKSVTIITILRVWCISIPVFYILTIFLDRGLSGMWIGEIISFIVFIPVMFHRFRKQKWAKLEF
ncbi:MATE family efflux transporter [Anaeromicrobium sediminis]|uniref:Probable multidrug resistance protein NorM n=1 Tax=Anaeromicrobium sediminis TaxID=1478221 RepID=A0A267MKB7_9FIRM|nr:MATE family efflux transporter [Anaeromicrobium sediminis]PAB59887.1 MATE family efflux transporter [Anaeromicrobium sediminis]